MQWYFLSDTQEQVPVQEEHLAGMVQTGVIRSNTLIWKEGMEQWVACSELKPELFAPRHVVPVVGAAATARQTSALRTQPVPATGALAARPGAATAGMQPGDGQLVREAASAFASAAGWMKFLGVLFLVAGVAYILMALFVVVTGSSADGGLLPGMILGLATATVGGVIMWMGMLLFQAAGKAQEAARTAQKHTLLVALQQNARFFRIWGISVVAVIVVYSVIIAVFFSMLAALFGGAALQGRMEAPEGFEVMDGIPSGADAVDPDDTGDSPEPGQ